MTSTPPPPPSAWILGKYIPLPDTVTEITLPKYLGQLSEWKALLWCTYRKQMYRKNTKSKNLLTTRTVDTIEQTSIVETEQTVTKNDKPLPPLSASLSSSSSSSLRLLSASDWQIYFNPTFTDTGYGCTIRSTQSLLVNAWLRHHCSHRMTKKDTDGIPSISSSSSTSSWFDSLFALPSEQSVFLYHSIVPYVLDWPTLPADSSLTKNSCLPSTFYAFQNYLQCGGYKKREGIWWGNYEVLHATSQLHHRMIMTENNWVKNDEKISSPAPFAIYLATDGIVVKETLYHHAYSSSFTPSSSAASTTTWQPVLLLIPLRLGYEYPIVSLFSLLQLIDYLRLPSFMGGLGGPPRHSCYIVGIVSYPRKEKEEKNVPVVLPPPTQATDNDSPSTVVPSSSTPSISTNPYSTVPSLTRSFRFSLSSSSSTNTSSASISVGSMVRKQSLTRKDNSVYYTNYNGIDRVRSSPTVPSDSNNSVRNEPDATETVRMDGTVREYRIMYMDPHTTQVCPPYPLATTKENDKKYRSTVCRTSSETISSGTRSGSTVPDPLLPCDTPTSTTNHRPQPLDGTIPDVIPVFRTSLVPPSSAWLMNIEELDPSIALAYYFRTENEWKEWYESIIDIHNYYRSIPMEELLKNDKGSTTTGKHTSNLHLNFLFEIMETSPNFEYSSTSSKRNNYNDNDVSTTSDSNVQSPSTAVFSDSTVSSSSSSSSLSSSNDMDDATNEWEVL